MLLFFPFLIFLLTFKDNKYTHVINVENRRISGRRVVQRQVLYLEEFNDTQRAGWVRTIEALWGESDPPPTGSGGKKRFGYSRDKRSDCVQVVVALVLTPEGFPVAYEVYPGNTRDTATLEEEFLDRIEKQCEKFRRTWLMDRGIPTEDMLEKMRSRGIDYLVGTPKRHLTRVEKPLLEQPLDAGA
ncbi:MAG: hypothetical protein DB853_16620 [Candidatus Brocadia sp.]|nr:MAG: hypothetical protein DB853_16620 [Candidatus Brocadia sp.]